MALLNKLLRKNRSDEQQQDQESTGFEIEDKPTPLAGRILLFIMAILLLILGWQGLNDVYNIPSEPQPLSNCISKYVTLDQNLSSRPKSRYSLPSLISSTPSDTCQFSKLEKKHNIPELHQQYKTARSQYDTLQKQITVEKQILQQVKRDLTRKQREYDLSLQEDIAERKDTAYDPETLKQNIKKLEQQKTTQDDKIKSLEDQVSQEVSEFQPQEEALRKAAQPLSKEHNRAWAVYRIWVFLLQLLFTLPAFILILKLYFKHKAKDSPYTLIFTTLLGVTGILLARVAVSYIWTLFLANLIIFLWDIIQQTALLRTLTFYLGMIIVVLIFGGAVYLLQKKVFDPRRVQKRRLRKGTCPHCQLPLQFAASNCPECGNQIKDKCSKCGKDKYIIMPHCPHCGEK